ncbi:MAG: hypothetical protein HYU99_10705 [Deltaproteobacteria bacterium]|nr:hypothetical protein [Deltaproteobacteria bacterium]
MKRLIFTTGILLIGWLVGAPKASSLVMSDDEILDWGRGEPLCVDAEKSRRYRLDFGINTGEALEECDCYRIEGTECEGELWQLLWSLSYIEDFHRAIDNPGRWITNLYSWVNRRIDMIREDQRGGRGVYGWNATSGHPDHQQIIYLGHYLFSRNNPIMRVNTLVHEARHSEAAGNYYLHVNCREGPLQGRAGCDQRYLRSGGGAYSFSVYIYAWLYYNGKDDEVSPAMKDWAKNTANAIIDNQFIEQPDYRLR